MTRLFDNSTVRVIINDQQRIFLLVSTPIPKVMSSPRRSVFGRNQQDIGHALAPRHWHTYQPTERQLRAAIARVLRSSTSEVHIARGIRIGVETATVYTRQVMIAGQKRRN